MIGDRVAASGASEAPTSRSCRPAMSVIGRVRVKVIIRKWISNNREDERGLVAAAAEAFLLPHPRYP